MQGNDLAIEVDGAIISLTAAQQGSGMGYYCSASATRKAAVGKVAIPMSAACGTENKQLTIYPDAAGGHLYHWK
jgi:hypothetical protein